VSFDELFFYLRSVFRLMNALQGGGSAGLEEDLDLVARSTAKEVLREADVSGDGLISLEEFIHWMSKPSASVVPSLGSKHLERQTSSVVDLADARKVLGLSDMSAEEVFEKLAIKANPRGELTLDAFSQVMMGCASKAGDPGRAKGLIAELFKKLDLDRNGVLDFSEVASGMSILAGGDTMSKLKAACALFDLNGDGVISKQEMVTYLTSVFSVVFATQASAAANIPGVTPEQLAIATADEAFAQSDLNHDGVLDFNEFAAWVSPCTPH